MTFQILTADEDFLLMGNEVMYIGYKRDQFGEASCLHPQGNPDTLLRIA